MKKKEEMSFLTRCIRPLVHCMNMAERSMVIWADRHSDGDGLFLAGTSTPHFAMESSTYSGLST